MSTNKFDDFFFKNSIPVLIDKLLEQRITGKTMDAKWYKALISHFYKRELTGEQKRMIDHILNTNPETLKAENPSVQFQTEIDKTSQTNNNYVYSNYLSLPKVSAALAVFCILFAPIVGCEGQNFNGVEIIQHKNIMPEVKLFIILSIACGVTIFFLRERTQIAICAIGGIITLLIAYLIAHNKNDAIDLRVGSYFAIIAYSITSVTSFLDISFNNFTETHVIKKSSSSPKIGVAEELKKLKELLDSGIITQQEFDTQKRKLLE